MHLHIKKIILWAKDPSKKPRILEFKEDAINVITGYSTTGKSAIISIIDYSMGSSKCRIPIGKIRDKTEWYGVLLKVGNSDMLLARRDPGNQVNSGDMYLEEGTSISIPSKIERNMHVNSIKERFNNLSGLPSLDFRTQDVTGGFKEKPSFRDVAAFNFQPQYIIANPHALFFKADTFEHQQKLKTIFPLALGVESIKSLELKHELMELEIDRDKLRKKVDTKKELLDEWKSKLKVIYLQAHERGLVADIPDDNIDWEPRAYINKLRRISSKLGDETPSVYQGATDRIVREINSLRREEGNISRSISDLKGDLVILDSIDASSHSYEDSLQIKQERLKNIGWFADMIDKDHVCPVCGKKTADAQAKLDKLIEIAKELASASSALQENVSVFDKERANIRKQIKIWESRLRETREAISMLRNESAEARKEYLSMQEVYRFVGSIEKYLDEISRYEHGDDATKQLQEIEERIAAIRKQIDEMAVEKKKLNALKRISSLMARYVEILEVEHSDRPVALDIKNLSLKISSPNGRDDFLWEIGSGANYMGYHLASMLALHIFFLSKRQNPVPSFLVLDQPSQVFFPEGFSDFEELKRLRGKKTEKKLDRDLERTQKIFEALNDAFIETQKQLQIIVIEHAGEVAWKDIKKNVYVAANWHSTADALVPREWLQF